MHTLYHPVFLFCLFLFCTNQVLELTGIYVWPLYTHLDDLLCLPIVLSIALAVERVYFQNCRYVFPVHYIIGAVIAFTVFFEGILPFFYKRHIADVVDVLAYVVGAAVFQVTINRPTR